MTELGFWRIAGREPDPIAVVEPDGRTHTRGELLASANRLSRVLRTAGLRTGDRIVAQVANEGAALALILASQQVGAYVAMVNSSLTRSEIAYVINDCEPILVVVSSRYGQTMSGAIADSSAELSQLFTLGPASIGSDLLACAADQSAEPLADRAAGSFMSYTSGTTGRPKGVQRALPVGDPDEVFDAGSRWQLGMFGIEELNHGCHLVTTPLSHTAVSGMASAALHFGHCVVLMDRFDAETTLALIERHRVTSTHMVPTQLHRIVHLPGSVRARYDVSSMRNLVHGAAACPESVKRATLELFGPVVWEYYGASEAAGTCIDTPHWLAKPGSVGRPQPGAEVQVLDADGRPQPASTVGTLYLRMGAHAFTYRGDADKTAATRIGDFCTVGDIGYIDEDGYVFVLGRTSELIVSGGVNIYPAEVEAALLEHPQIEDAAVIGLPDDEWGETCCAVVQVAAGSTLAADPQQAPVLLGEFLADRLARYKTPRRYEVVDALPRADNGKLRKQMLKAALLDATKDRACDR